MGRTLKERLTVAEARHAGAVTELGELWETLDADERTGALDYLARLEDDVKELRARAEAREAEDHAVTKHAPVTKARRPAAAVVPPRAPLPPSRPWVGYFALPLPASYFRTEEKAR